LTVQQCYPSRVGIELGESLRSGEAGHHDLLGRVLEVEDVRLEAEVPGVARLPAEVGHVVPAGRTGLAEDIRIRHPVRAAVRPVEGKAGPDGAAQQFV